MRAVMMRAMVAMRVMELVMVATPRTPMGSAVALTSSRLESRYEPRTLALVHYNVELASTLCSMEKLKDHPRSLECRRSVLEGGNDDVSRLVMMVKTPALATYPERLGFVP